jgi:hypothetical protein
MTDTSPGPADTTGTGRPADDQAAHQEAAAQIRRQHPGWVTVWVPHLGQYRAYPLFRAPRGTALTARTPADLAAQMDQIEQAASYQHGKPQDTDTTS